MKKQALGIVMALWFVTLATVCARAQSGMAEARATIPFDFIIDGQTLPAGGYTIARVSQDGKDVLKLSRADGTASAMFNTKPVDTVADGGRTQLVFHRYGEQYFLSQIWSPHDNTIHELYKCRRERGLVREIAGHTTTPRANVLVALHRR